MGNWFESLKERGLVQDCSCEDTLKNLPKGTGFYVGFDPTAPSLQLGNLVPLVVAMHLAKAGFTPYILFGGATGTIGDPSGKDKERNLLEYDVITQNIHRQEEQVRKLFQSQNVSANFVNNLDWTKDVSVLQFLRDTGKFFTVNYMIAKEVVKTRLEGSGISYTEFSYMLLQAFDFDYLLRTKGVALQFGGSDQWGNITAGLELIRKKGSGDAAAFSFPLLTNSEGKKFGKSADGALWLDQTMTSPFKLHQFLFNSEDEEAVKYLKVLTFISLEEVREISAAHTATPEKRIAQNRLADELVRMIHGQDALHEAHRSKEVLFGGTLEGLSEQALSEIFHGVPSSEMPRAHFLEKDLGDLFVESSLVSSRGEAKRLFTQGGAYVNNESVRDPMIKTSDLTLLFPNMVILRSGKKKYHLLRILEA